MKNYHGEFVEERVTIIKNSNGTVFERHYTIRKPNEEEQAEISKAKSRRREEELAKRRELSRIREEFIKYEHFDDIGAIDRTSGIHDAIDEYIRNELNFDW